MPDRRVAGLAVALAVVLLIPAGPAPAAEDVTAAELRRLASRAERDPAAREELARVRRVDGRPVDVGAALAGADDDQRRARLRTLSEGTAGAAPPAAEARDEARRILDRRRYNPAEPPRPLRGVLRRIGGWLRPIGELFDDLRIPWPVQMILAVAALAVAMAVAGRLVRRRRADAVDAGTSSRRRRHDDPAALEREADDAERRGELDLALRLRFRAGLLRLDAAGAVKLKPSLTTGDLRRRLRSETLHDLTTAFEAVAYAGEHADADDVAAARQGWPRVLQEVARR